METAFAFQKAGADVSMVHIGELMRAKLEDYGIMVLPEVLPTETTSARKVSTNEISLKLGDDVKRFVEKGGLLSASATVSRFC